MFRTTSMMIWAISFIAFAPFAFADAGGNWIVHENPAPGEGYSEQSTLQMTAEYVDIVLHPEYAQVSAVFEFENTGPECSVGMVFPLQGALKPVGGGWEKEKNSYSYEHLYEVETDFQVTVDDSTPLDYSVIKLSPYEESKLIPGYAEWYLNFDAGQKRVVSCYYTSDYGGPGRFTFNEFAYVVHTGSSWKGPIGYGKITVQPGQDFADDWWKRFLLYEDPGLPPAQDLGDQIVWEFENWEPVHDEQAFIGNSGGIYIYLFQDVTEEAYYPSIDREDLAGRPWCPGKISAPFGINFSTEPDSNSPLVPGKETLANGETIVVLERDGDWYYVRTSGGYYGWVRWRYIDPESGEEYRCIDLQMEPGLP